MLWTWLAGCLEPGGGAFDAAACMECADITTHGWCGATSSCVTIASGDCAYGLAVLDSECEQPGRFLPTALPVDCRDTRQQDAPECQRVQDLPASSFGTGVNIVGYDLGGGFIDGDRLILAFACDLCTLEQSGILAVDLRTGERTLLSGRIEDPLQGLQEVGQGEFPTSFDTVQPAPDGSWIALDAATIGAEIYRIDPDTGDREVLYRQGQLDAGGNPVCELDGYGLNVGWAVPTTPNEGMANLAVGDDGALWLRGSLFGTVSEDLGLEALVALRDGECEVVTAYSYYQPLEIGAGSGAPLYDFLPWLVLDGERMLAVPDQQTLQGIDLQTGQRVVLSSANEGTPLGEGPLLGDDFALLDARGRLLTSGPETGGAFVRIDLESGDREGLVALGGPYTYADNGPILPYPAHEGVYLVAWEGLVLFEPETGNSNVFSR